MAGRKRKGLRVNWDRFKLAPYLELCEREGLTYADIFSKINFVIANTGICARFAGICPTKLFGANCPYQH